MRNRRTIWIVMGVLAAILIIGVAQAVVFAQEATPVAPVGRLMHGFGGRGACGQAGLDAAAKALNMTSAELSAQLWGGKTLADLADKAGVSLQTIQSAVQAACQAATKDAIQQAVKNGTISQGQADWLIEGLDKGYWGGQNSLGFGFGPGRHGFRGFGGFGVPKGSSPNNGGSTSPSRFVF